MQQIIAKPTQAEYENGAVPIQCSGWPPAQLLSPYSALDADIDTDVVVIGAGLAGASVALHLAERGIGVVSLEARQPGDGASGRNAGHVQTFLDALEPLQTWPDRGSRFVDFFIQHRDIVFELCRKHGIDGDAVKTGMVEAAFKKHGGLERKAAIWKNFGYAVDSIGSERLQELLGTKNYHYGLHWREGGRVNPYLFTNGMIAAATRFGARVHGDSPVIACEREQQRWRVRTAQGSVRAQQVVICTNGHAGNNFFPELARTQYPLVACGMATKPLPNSMLDIINPARVTLTQFPTGLYPLVIDGRNRLITATIPFAGRAAHAHIYFAYFLRYLRRTYPQIGAADIELESYWTGQTASSSAVYHHDYPKLYQVADGVLALMNLGTWGNVMGPQMGMNVAQAIAEQRPQDFVLPLEKPAAVRFPRRFEFKIRRLLIPAARLVDWLKLA